MNETVGRAIKGTCRDCGGAMELFEYLVESLKLHNAPWPIGGRISATRGPDSHRGRRASI